MTMVFYKLSNCPPFQMSLSSVFLDYEKVLELEPDNFEATNELRKIDQVNYKHLSALGLTFIS